MIRIEVVRQKAGILLTLAALAGICMAGCGRSEGIPKNPAPVPTSKPVKAGGGEEDPSTPPPIAPPP